MMKILRFTLSGKQAFFKKPEVNSYYYFSYGHMHKVAMLGMFGAILGYAGYNDNIRRKEAFPEFYARLRSLKISMIPVCEKGSFPRKIVSFNNSVGYASKEQGGNLIVKQQWLENPEWYVYVFLDCEEAEKLADYITGGKCIYMPYLGTNDHPADITDFAIIEAESVASPEHIDSLVERDKVQIDLEDYEQNNPYKYEEALPYGLDEELNAYQMKRYILTNMAVIQCSCEVYSISERDNKSYNIVFD